MTMVGTAHLIIMKKTNQRSLGARTNTTDRLTNTLFTIEVLTITTMSVAKKPCSRKNRILKFSSLNPKTSLPTFPHKKTMFQNRLVNILGYSPDVNRATTVRTRSTEWATYKWQLLFQKSQLIFKFMWTAMQLEHLIGQENLRRLFQDTDLRRMEAQAQAQSDQPARLVQIGNNRFIFGRMLPPTMENRLQ